MYVLGLPDNEVTKHLSGEMRLKEAIWLMVRRHKEIYELFKNIESKRRNS